MESLSPFLWGSFIPYNMPVYPGAQRVIAKALIEVVGLEGNYMVSPRAGREQYANIVHAIST